MSCYIHDPGMALFLAAPTKGEDHRSGSLEWTAFAATFLLGIVALSAGA